MHLMHWGTLAHPIMLAVPFVRTCGTLEEGEEHDNAQCGADIYLDTLPIDQQGSENEVMKQEDQQKDRKLLPHMEHLVPAILCHIAVLHTDIHTQHWGSKEHAP